MSMIEIDSCILAYVCTCTWYNQIERHALPASTTIEACTSQSVADISRDGASQATL
ncbi:hypothetical protein DL93DRAFT_2078532 [Clavulina sp. PMI_390]|nr:hypothetical protein DL93DRAFT_2078532 [Clavulina sp. PMI_390]